MSIATAAKQIVVDRMDVMVAGGVESISLAQTPEIRLSPDPELLAMHKNVYMPMIGTAEVVARRYSVSRDRRTNMRCARSKRTAAAQYCRPVRRGDRPGHRHDGVKNKETGETSMQEVTIAKDEGNRPDTTIEGPRARCSR